MQPLRGLPLGKGVYKGSMRGIGCDFTRVLLWEVPVFHLRWFGSGFREINPSRDPPADPMGVSEIRGTLSF